MSSRQKVGLPAIIATLVNGKRVDNALVALLEFFIQADPLVRRVSVPVSLESIRAAHISRKDEIAGRLAEFQEIRRSASDERLWEELVYCIFTAGASARMGLRSIEAVRGLLSDGDAEDLTRALRHVHRYPAARPRYIIVTREYLREHFAMRLRERLESFSDSHARRDWLAREPRIKGLGYKEASHFLRNVGYRGYSILDKHILRCLAELGLIERPVPPTTRDRYLSIEDRFQELSRSVGIDGDELDLVLWSMKTGEVLK